MQKLCVFLLAVIAVAAAKPGYLAAPVAYTGVPVAAPVAYTAAAPVVTATSSQYFARNYNGIVSPYVATAPYVASAAYPYSAYPYAAAYSYPSAAVVV